MVETLTISRFCINSFSFMTLRVNFASDQLQMMKQRLVHLSTHFVCYSLFYFEKKSTMYLASWSLAEKKSWSFVLLGFFSHFQLIFGFEHKLVVVMVLNNIFSSVIVGWVENIIWDSFVNSSGSSICKV